MVRTTVSELAGTMAQLQAQMAEIARRIAELEHENAPAAVVTTAAPPAPAPEGITEEELLAISAAIGAYLGVRAHIRQIRLLGGSAWAQQGRVSIQASHMLQS
jgi:methylmalonyl-CoA carboxyltransferase large subunit